MDYMVFGSDGKEYGPVNEDGLRTWVSQSRVTPQTQLKDFHSGRVLLASEIPGLFGQAAPQPVYGAPMAQPMAPNRKVYSDEDSGVLIGVILRSVAAVGIFF